jgi:hypothetical protein
MVKETGRTPGDVVRSYMEASRSEKAREKREAILASGRSASDIQQALLDLEASLERATLGTLGNAAEPAPAGSGSSTKSAR